MGRKPRIRVLEEVDAADEENDDGMVNTEYDEPEPEPRDPKEESFLVHYWDATAKRIVSFKVPFEPDAEYLKNSVGAGTYTVMKTDIDPNTKKKKWFKQGTITVEPEKKPVPIVTNVPAPARNPLDNPGDDLNNTISQFDRIVTLQLKMALAKAIAGGNMAEAKEIRDILSPGQMNAQKNSLEELQQKLFLETITKAMSPRDPMKEMQASLEMLQRMQNLSGLGPPAPKSMSDAIVELADKHLPSILQTAEKNQELQKKALEVRAKQLEIQQANATKNAGIAMNSKNPLDDLINAITGNTTPGHVQMLVTVNPGIDQLKGIIGGAFNTDAMPDEQFDALLGAFESGNATVQKVLDRAAELSVANPGLKPFLDIFRTPNGQQVLDKTLKIVEAMLKEAVEETPEGETVEPLPELQPAQPPAPKPKKKVPQ